MGVGGTVISCAVEVFDVYDVVVVVLVVVDEC